MENTHATIKSPQGTALIWIASEMSVNSVSERKTKLVVHFNPLKPIRQWLDQIQVSDRKMAQTLASVIPAQCPFERTVKLFNRTILYIPPLCKLNPFYEELVGLRFRALCYLADECGEDISVYC
ncbi:Mo-dependent nitrogenase-like protein [Leptolyngbyaceae cyanobacterium JSC-12]|nr:Mo-dependent nitrogenase-like protein [Leptolyngbyaceae cyanobacterium JSC-12]